MNSPDDGAISADPGAAPWSTVLCVDDEPNILSALKRVLRGAGHVVLSAGSGATALAAAPRRWRCSSRCRSTC